jgi:hypothetical protein
MVFVQGTIFIYIVVIHKVANPVVQGAGGGAYPKDTGLYAGVFYFTILKGYTIKDFTAIYNYKL